MDIDTIEPGDDFRKVVRNAVGSCDVVLVMIGKQWQSMTDAQGRRRLDDPEDWVRVEIATALANPDVRVIPVLVRGASMPGEQELPGDLKELSWRNAIELSDSRFQHDANRLAGVIERTLERPGTVPAGRQRKSNITRYWPIVLGMLLLGLVIGTVVYGRMSFGTSQAPPPTMVDTAADPPGPAGTAGSNGLPLIRTIASSGQISSAALSTDGQIAALGSYDGTIKLWSTSEDTLLGTLKAGTTVLSLALSKDSQMLAAGLSSTVVKVWRLSDGTALTPLEGLPDEVYSTTFSPDGRRVAGGAAPDVLIWQVSDGMLLHTLAGHSSRNNSLAFSSDGERLASGGYYAVTKLWQLSDSTLLRDLESGELGIVAFSPTDAELLATSGNGGSVYIWRVRDGALLHDLAGHTKVVESIAFSGDGQTLVSVSNDIEVRRWQVSDGTRLYTRTLDGQNVQLTRLSEDGKVLMAVYIDGTVRLWQVP
jgi:sugar lactone lactonase YvrE